MAEGRETYEYKNPAYDYEDDDDDYESTPAAPLMATVPGPLNQEKLQPPITVASNMKCKPGCKSRAVCQIPRMKKPLC